VFHALLLSAHKETFEYGPTAPMPIPDLIEGHHEFEVESILAHWLFCSTIQFFIKWKGYTHADSTWELLQNLTHCLPILMDYCIGHSLILPNSDMAPAPHQ